MPFNVIFDLDKFMQDLGQNPLPKPSFPINTTDHQNNHLAVKTTLSHLAQTVIKPPSGRLSHPYLVPGAIYDQLWDWDAYFMGLGIIDDHLLHFRGCILNFLEHIQENGHPAKLIHPNGAINYDDIPYPIQAQWCVAVSRQLGRSKWVKPWWQTLVACRTWYEKISQQRRGLFRQPVSRGAGLDNDPVVYGRQHDTVAMVDINCFHYREYLSLAYLASELGKDDDAALFRDKASQLKKAINEYMWDPIDGMFYHLDLSDHVDVTRQEITWEIPYKVRSAATLFVLWAGVADIDKAKRVIEEHVLNPDEFLSDYGIRSLAKNERMYNNMPMGDPSNWQGPVWGLVTALVAYGLARYGYKTEAIAIGKKLNALFAGDIRSNGTLHEYYHADTGAPVFNPGFLSWNLLAMRLLDDLSGDYDPTEIST